MKIFGNPVKRKLRDNQLVVGSWIAMSHPWVADIMGQCGFEFLVVELEHSTIELDSLNALFAVTELHSVVPLARLSGIDPVQAKRVLEAGAYGLIFPMVNTAEEARRAVDAVKYPPQGKRGFGLGRAQDFGFGSADYFAKANDETIVILQVEHIDGVNNIDAILEVEGVDAVFIGPYDLSGSLGVPGKLSDPKVVAACKRVLDAATARGIAPGMHIVHPDAERFRQAVDDGFRFIAYGGDILYLGESCKKAMADIDR
ncbi:MAG: 2,4-dihydroxyhept-2-ene-1,7-dioic acid aldolase [Planctomycetes bacterium]|nr:2,4-dihydroxyhept-2-ene-1,7-dioic acid aldolase [Planctomycetota bacterium]